MAQRVSPITWGGAAGPDLAPKGTSEEVRPGDSLNPACDSAMSLAFRHGWRMGQRALGGSRSIPSGLAR
jgi:hypothetical protein